MTVSHALKAKRRLSNAPESDAERQVRVDLAACYRLAALNGWDDLVFTHISARIPGTHDFLINPFGLGFDEITASSLVRIDLDGNIVGDSPYEVNAAGFTIHSAVHQARPEIGCVMHLHTEAGMALSMMQGGLLPTTQHAMRFHNRIGYHDYEGIALSLDERQRLIDDLGAHKLLVLRNHGTLTAGETVAEAYVLMFYLEKASRAQITAMSTGAQIVLPPDSVAEHTARLFEGDTMAPGAREWPAQLRRLDRVDPSYKD
jgi:ribulose-5-phosphate 4-epimerase/fuculose-1-phosphate aldolase